MRIRTAYNFCVDLAIQPRAPRRQLKDLRPKPVVMGRLPNGSEEQMHRRQPSQPRFVRCRALKRARTNQRQSESEATRSTPQAPASTRCVPSLNATV